jgi:hypothetical protein
MELVARAREATQSQALEAVVWKEGWASSSSLHAIEATPGRYLSSILVPMALILQDSGNRSLRLASASRGEQRNRQLAHLLQNQA